MFTRTRQLSFALLAFLLLVLVGCKGGKSDESSVDAAAIAPVDEGIIFRDGFSEQTIPGRLAVTDLVSETYPACEGFIAAEPTLEFRFDGDVPARIHVVAEVDTILVIASEQGVDCDDNFDLQHPSLHKLWASGSYKVFVGTAEFIEEPFDYDLNFDHYDPARPIEGRPIPGTVFNTEAADADAADAAEGDAAEGDAADAADAPTEGE